MRIEKDVEGINGLHVGYDMFDEKTEIMYFHQPDLWPSREITEQTNYRHSLIPVLLHDFPSEIFELCKIIETSKLIDSDHFIFPNYCLSLSYPIGSKFAGHFDSRYRWGIYIIGVNLGSPCMLSMSFPGDSSKTKKVLLPRRSIYVMSGDARYLYKHAISKINKIDDANDLANDLANKEWNKKGIRRSFTLRCSKIYETVYLEHKLKLGKNEILTELIKENQLFKPRKDHDSTKNMTKEEIENDRQEAEFHVGMIGL